MHKIAYIPYNIYLMDNKKKSQKFKARDVRNF